MDRRSSRLAKKCWRCGTGQFGVLLALTLALVSGSAVAAPPTPAQVAQARADLRTYYAWINAPWTGNDQPYKRIRDGIEGAIASGRNPSDLLKQYQASLAKSPKDFQAQFAYYYAAYKVAITPGTGGPFVGLELLGNLSTIIIRSPHPRTYNYARLLFLCDQYNTILLTQH